MKKATTKKVSLEKLAKSFDEFAETAEKSGVNEGYGSMFALTWILVMCHDCYGEAMIEDVLSTYKQFTKEAA